MRCPLPGSFLPVLGLAAYSTLFQYIKTYIENSCQVLFEHSVAHYAAEQGAVTAQQAEFGMTGVNRAGKTVGTTRFALKWAHLRCRLFEARHAHQTWRKHGNLQHQ
jgi:hypothetical protein